jgi:hypothetical protein
MYHAKYVAVIQTSSMNNALTRNTPSKGLLNSSHSQGQAAALNTSICVSRQVDG